MSQSPNDKQELVPIVAAIQVAAGLVAAALVDSGFFSAAAVEQIAQTARAAPTSTLVYAAEEKTGHHRSVADLEVKPDPVPPVVDASEGGDALPARRSTSCGNKRSNRSSGSSNRCSVSGSSDCEDRRKYPWNGRWSAWLTI